MQASALFDVLHQVTCLGQSLEGKTIDEIVSDHRKIRPNSCFIAIKGQHFDGHSVIEQVVASGARIVVVEYLEDKWLSLPVSIILVKSTFRAQAILANAFFDRPSQALKVVAVTGTNGKTTTSTMISDWLTALGHKTGLLGTMHYKVDQTYYPAINTTPDALRLQSLFREMVASGCQDAIIEASSHALYLGRLWYTDVDCAIFTNLTREHLDFHKTMEDYAYAKSLLFSQLGQTLSHNKTKLAILNMDDPYHVLMAQVTAAEIVTYSLKNQGADFFASHIRTEKGRTLFNLHYLDKTYPVSLAMLGDYNVANYLAAMSCLVVYYGYQVQDVIAVTKDFKGVPGRMQVIDLGQAYQVVVDFAHTPDALDNILNQLSQEKTGKLRVLFGHSGGNRDSGARPDLGDILFKYADDLMFTADNPRNEDVTSICQAMIQDHQEVPYQIIEDRHLAVQALIAAAQPGDTLVFAGKGSEPYQVIGDQYLPYDEVAVISQAIQARK